ncbi:MAG: hypothetical protein ACP6IP_03060 [Candidatus Njordarchaeia archaeon]
METLNIYIIEIVLVGLLYALTLYKFIEIRNKSILLLVLSITFAELTSITRFLACVQPSIGAANLLFRISIIFTFLPPLLIVALFNELSEGEIHYGWLLIAIALLGYCIKVVISEQIKLIGSPRNYVFIRPFLPEVITYYLLLTILLTVFSFNLYFKGRKKFRERDTVRILNVALSIPLLAIAGIILEAYLMVVEKVSGRSYYLIGIPFILMSIVLIFILFREPRFYLLSPFKVYWLIVLDKVGGVEVYSKVFKELSVSTELIGGLLTAIINYSQEIFGNRIIRRMSIPDSELIIETSEHFLAAIVTEKYHENIPVVLNMALEELEKSLATNETLREQIERGIIDVSSWSHIFELSVENILFPIIP